MDRESMSNEENYCFDVAGYLHIPGFTEFSERQRVANGRVMRPPGHGDGLIENGIAQHAGPLIGGPSVFRRQPKGHQ